MPTAMFLRFICLTSRTLLVTEADYEAAKAFVSDPEAYDFKKILNW